MQLFERIRIWGSLVKFSHSIFALPFALLMVVLVARDRGVSFAQFLAIILCVVSARTAAMAFNRLVDRRFDTLNPRTQSREIPAGKVSYREAVCLTAGASALFIAGAYMLGWHCFILSPLVLLLLLGYSLLKRFSSLCHVALGLALACAPGGVWYALTATWSIIPLPLMFAVLFWVAGFDILYSCQDVEFDRSHSLRSIPVSFGVSRSIAIAATLHCACVVALLISCLWFHQGPIMYIGLVAFAALIASQYAAISRRGISCVDQVFLTRNGFASAALCAAGFVDAIVFWG